MAADKGLKARDALTDQQRQALETRDVAVALSAGAGCGKTFVLTQRYLSHVAPPAPEQPAELSELLAITFTKAASREMRERIRGECRRRLASGDAAADWGAVLRQLDQARIDTIDAFCTSLLRAYPAQAGVDPSFRVLDAVETLSLKHRAVEQAFLTRLQAHDEAFIHLLSECKMSDLSGMLLIALKGEMLSSRNPEANSNALPSDDLRQVQLGVDATEEGHAITRQSENTWEEDLGKHRIQELAAAQARMEAWKQLHRDHIFPRILHDFKHSSEFQRLQEIVQFPPDAPDPVVERFAQLREAMQVLGTSGDFGQEMEYLRSICRVNDIRAGWSKSELYNAFKEIANAVRGSLNNLNKAIIPPDDELLMQAQYDAAFVELLQEVQDNYQAAKDALQGLEFSDLLQKTLMLLESPRHAELAAHISHRFRLVLVDEFQDTSSEQVRLVERLCGAEMFRGKLFFVGDHKQSIYRFRGAEPQVFKELRDRTPEQGRLRLSKNFRSQAGILSFVNGLFAEVFPNEHLSASWPNLDPAPRVEFLWASLSTPSTSQDGNDSQSKELNARDENDSEPSSEKEDASPTDKSDDKRARARRKCEGRYIARRIHSLLNDPTPRIRDKRTGQPRRVKQGDICLLFRSMSNVDIYERELREAGLSYYVDGGHGFYSQQEVYDVYNLLSAVSDPCDEVALAGLLRGPFCGLKDETLLNLAAKQKSFGEMVYQPHLSAVADRVEREKASAALKWLLDLRSKKDRMPLADLLDYAISSSGYDAAVIAEFMGERKLANLEKLLDRARVASDSAALGLQGFLLELSERLAKGTEEAQAAAMDEQADVIRIMTIHKSKGLEFPVVFIVDVFAETKRNSENVFYHPSMGLVSKWDAAGAAWDWLSNMYRRLVQAEEEAESKRLLYVAATRAADLLVFSACPKELDKLSNVAVQLLAERFDLQSGAYLHPNGKSEETPSVRVVEEKHLVSGGEAVFDRVRVSTGLKAFREFSLADADPLSESVAPIASKGLPEGFLQAGLGAEVSFSALKPYLEESASQAGQKTLFPLSERPRTPIEPQNTPAWDFQDWAGDSDWASLEEAHNDDDATQVGKLVHRALAAFPWHRWSRDADSNRQLLSEWFDQDMASFGETSARQKSRAEKLASSFFHLELAAELAAAKQRWFEMEFLLPWPDLNPPQNDKARPVGNVEVPANGLGSATWRVDAGDAPRGPFDDANGRGGISTMCRLRGFMDCVFQDASGGWRVLDFKTNRNPAKRLNDLVFQYEPQMLLYASALASALGEPVTCSLVFLEGPLVHTFPRWDQPLIPLQKQLNRVLHYLEKGNVLL